MKRTFFLSWILFFCAFSIGIAETYTVRDAWWTGMRDSDCDGYLTPGSGSIYEFSGRLVVDVDVNDPGSFAVDIEAKFYTFAGALVKTFTRYKYVSGSTPADSTSWGIDSYPAEDFPHDRYIIVIRVFKHNTTTLVATRSFDQDPDLSVYLERDSENTPYPCFTITDIFWSDELDPDHDGYFLSKTLNYTISLVGNLTCSEYRFEKVVYALYYIDWWHDLYVFRDENIVFTPAHTSQTWSENTSSSLNTLEFREYKFGIQADMAPPDRNAFRENCDSYYANSNTVPLLANQKFETEAQTSCAIECNHIDWADPPGRVDQDGDGYRAKDMLYLSTGSWSDCYYKVYYKPANQTEYSYYATTNNHILDPEATISQPFGNPTPELAHGLYDFKLELYNTNTDHLVATYDEKTDPPLNDQKFERSDEDGSSSSNVCLTLNLTQGWNMFSLNVIPDNPNISTVLGSISSKTTIAKSGDGKTWIPKYGINDIGEIKTGQGYQLYMKEAATVEICGMEIEPSTAIPLPAGWSLISYLPRTAMSATNALASIQNQLVVAKNNDGQTYIPAYGINVIDQMQPGQGYQVYLKDAAELVYPAGEAW